MIENKTVKCPITGWDAIPLYEVKRKDIKEKISLYYNKTVPPEIFDKDYKMYKVKETGFEFAHPMCSGSEKFYKWIIEQEDYYPKDRWEWGEVIKQIRQDEGVVSLLEVGCGSGLFLRYLTSFEKCKSIGIDTSADAIALCEKRGLKCFCSKLEDFKKNEMFDYVVSFHCLEHVEDPLGFVRSMLKRIKNNGKILISTPYSPMSFENKWFDPLNHPPHHLTRWNVASYEALAKKLKCNVNFLFPSAQSILYRVLTSLKIRWFGCGGSIKSKRFIKKFLFSLNECGKEFLFQIKRDKVKGKVLPNVVLVEIGKGNFFSDC